MSADKVRQDATASTRATIYHLCVAIDKCYQLKDGQKLLIEELGDITIEGEQQIEVKQYSDRLTDGHLNLWNTFRNWIDDEFDHTSYTSLILHSTQEFGPDATISEWNIFDVAERIAILLEINDKFEKAYKKAKIANPNRIASAVLVRQRYVLDSMRRTKLSALIGKVYIETTAKALPELYDELKHQIRGILSGKKNDFLNSLIGFVCRPGKNTGERWEITFEEFSDKLEELTNNFRSETRVFPYKHFSKIKGIAPDEYQEDLFVTKIHEIEHYEAVPRAIHYYEAAIQTINEEFDSYRTEPDKFKAYSRAVEDRFKTSHSMACRKCSDEIPDSKNFYDETHMSQPPGFPGFQDSPDWFRNGLLHICMNDNEYDYLWRVSKK